MTIACSALTTKLSTTCCSSVQHRQHVLRRLVLDAQLDVLGLEAPLPQLGDRRDDVDQAHSGAASPGLLPGEQREVADDAAGARALLLDQPQVGLARRRARRACICSSSAKPRIACSGLLISCATPDTSWPTAASRSWRITWRCSDCSFLAHAALLGHLRVERGARLVEAAQHLVERLLQLGELARRHRLALDRAEVAGGDALRRGLEMRDRLAEPPRQHDRDDQPAGEAEREHRERARPQRQRAVEGHRHGNADAHQPRRAVDRSVRRRPGGRRRSQSRSSFGAHPVRRRQRSPADVAFGLDAARQQPARPRR